ncbi:Kinase, NEK [Giardia muris]|uniref:non-specific serine/threonine protein kinase n=1 Tax=Giardia muris TaxID=5742 RepID=A0A4Z1SU05_GIAMU|nr:Kinase, NEK [Giardia muris]|eukprot:TNJ29376.1 Kinase, NEK [Giardia muris]
MQYSVGTPYPIFEDEYGKGVMIGEGAFAKVFACTRRGEKQVYAVKEVDYSHLSEKYVDLYQFEARILTKLHHPNLAYIECTFDDPVRQVWHTVMDLYDNGDVATMITQYRGAGMLIPEERVWEIFGQMVDVLAYLHRLYRTDVPSIHRILHRNLRPDNILLKSNGVIGLGTLRLGTEQTINTNSTEAVGPLPYTAPEVLRHETYGPLCDAWSLGCIIAEICTQQRVFDDPLVEMGSILPIKLRGYSKELELLVNGLLDPYAGSRRSCTDICDHPKFVEARARTVGKVAPLTHV